MSKYEDTYFFHSQEALRVASQQNRFDNNEKLQVCYYDGEFIESDLPNLIHLPIDNLLEGLAMGRLRVPTKVDFTGLELSSIVKVDITTNFNMSLYQVREYRAKYNEHYFNVLAGATLDFSEPLRFYLSANATTQVMQYVSRNIADELEDMGFEVMYDLYHGMEDTASLKNISEFNPHGTININHFNNTYLNKNCFNFVWFQDPMPSFFDATVMEVRPRDTVFSLLESIDKLLINKGVNKDEIIRQSIRTSTHIYNTNFDIKREDKIVFIGGSYNKHEEHKEIMDELRDSLVTRKVDMQALSKKYFVDLGFIENHLYPSVLRQEIVIYACKHSNMKVEVYGPGWENFEEVMPFYKGLLGYGEDVARIYNSAKYSLVPNGYYQQRLFEMASCGTIPIVYDSPIETEKFKYEDSCLMFKDLKELDTITSNEVKDNLEAIQRDASYADMAENMLKTIKSKLENE